MGILGRLYRTTEIDFLEFDLMCDIFLPGSDHAQLLDHLFNAFGIGDQVSVLIYRIIFFFSISIAFQSFWGPLCNVPIFGRASKVNNAI